MCKVGETNEPHLVFEYPELQNIREEMGLSFNLPKYLLTISFMSDYNRKLQHFLSGRGATLFELQKRAEFLEALTHQSSK